MARCCVSDRCYLLFDPFSSTVDFFESYATSEIKLKAIGLAPSAISWFNSYLSQRSQVVRINAELSDALPVMYGVPQGSVLGALLFSIYVNDLPAVSEVCSTACYVDDTKLILSFTVDECHATEEKVNADLQRIRDWCFENYLLLNPDKTKLMVFGSQHIICKLPSFKLSFLGKELLPTDSVKDLGVIFDPTLSFDSHITALAATCISRLAQINRAKHAFNPNLLVNIINALVFSRLTVPRSGLIHLTKIYVNCNMYRTSPPEQ